MKTSLVQLLAVAGSLSYVAAQEPGTESATQQATEGELIPAQDVGNNKQAAVKEKPGKGTVKLNAPVKLDATSTTVEFDGTEEFLKKTNGAIEYTKFTFSFKVNHETMEAIYPWKTEEQPGELVETLDVKHEITEEDAASLLRQKEITPDEEEIFAHAVNTSAKTEKLQVTYDKSAPEAHLPQGEGDNPLIDTAPEIVQGEWAGHDGVSEKGAFKLDPTQQGEKGVVDLKYEMQNSSDSWVGNDDMIQLVGDGESLTAAWEIVSSGPGGIQIKNTLLDVEVVIKWEKRVHHLTEEEEENLEFDFFLEDVDGDGKLDGPGQNPLNPKFHVDVDDGSQLPDPFENVYVATFLSTGEKTYFPSL